MLLWLARSARKGLRAGLRKIPQAAFYWVACGTIFAMGVKQTFSLIALARSLPPERVRFYFGVNAGENGGNLYHVEQCP